MHYPRYAAAILLLVTGLVYAQSTGTQATSDVNSTHSTAPKKKHAAKAAMPAEPAVTAADLQVLKDGLATAQQQIQALQEELRRRDQAAQQAQATAADAAAKAEAAQVRRPYLIECAGSLRRIGLSGPHRSVVVLGHRQRDAPRASGVIGERMPMPPVQGADGADPHAPVARGSEAKHLGVRQPLSLARRPAHEVDAIELHDPVGSADPHVSVRRLDDC